MDVPSKCTIVRAIDRSVLVQLGVNYHNDRVKTGGLIDAYLLYTTCR